MIACAGGMQVFLVLLVVAYFGQGLLLVQLISEKVGERPGFVIGLVAVSLWPIVLLILAGRVIMYRLGWRHERWWE